MLYIRVNAAIGSRIYVRLPMPETWIRLRIVSTFLLLSICLLHGCNIADRSTPAVITGIAEVNGTTLYYEVQGRGHPLVLLEGGNLDLRMWDLQFKEFASEYRVIRYDVRSFGRSGVHGESYLAHEDLRALLDHLSIEQAHLVGLSLGGRIAVDFALEYPNRVKALVLAGPGLSGFEWSSTGNEWFGPIWEAMQVGDSIRAAKLWLDSPYMAPAMEHKELALQLRRLATENSRVWADQNTEVPLSPPAAGRLEEISAPTLVILGSRDVPDIHRIVELLITGVQGARRVIVEGSGHMVNMERPEAFNDLVLEFLEGR